MRKTFSVAVIAAFFLLATWLFLGLAAGCGKAERDYSKDLETAAEGFSAAGSAHALVNATISPLEGEGGLTLNAQGDVWVDLSTPSLEARFTVLGMELSLRYTGGRAFIRLGGNWYSLSEESLGVDGQVDASLMKLPAALPKAIASSAAVLFRGEKKVGSFDCAELEVRLDFQALAEVAEVRELAEDLGVGTEELVETLSGSHPEIRVCLQKDQPVLRQLHLAADLELSSLKEMLPVGLLPEKGHLEVTVDFPEYGVEVRVEAPAEARPFTGL